MAKVGTRSYRSEIAAVMQGMVEGFERAGLVDKQTMRRFDEARLTGARSRTRSAAD